MRRRSDTGQIHEKSPIAHPGFSFVPLPLGGTLAFSSVFPLHTHTQGLVHHLRPLSFLLSHSEGFPEATEVSSMPGSCSLDGQTDVANKDSFNLTSSFVIFGNSVNLSWHSFFTFLEKNWYVIYRVKCTSLMCNVWSKLANTHICVTYTPRRT